MILAGYSSGSKWSLFGAIREAAQVVSYEVPLGMCVVIPVLVVGSMDLTTIANFQQGLFTNWLIFHNPFTFIVFFAYFTCALASVNRAPFDLAEAESELVAGFHTEYSGLRWSYFFMAEYGSMFTVSLLAALLFFGGWHGPIPIFTASGLGELSSTEGFGFLSGPFLGWLVNVCGMMNLILKAVIGVIVMIWVRWSLPRLRIDQVITMCLKYCVPIAAVCFIGVVGWQLFQLPSARLIAAPRDSDGNVIRDGMVREVWVEERQRLSDKRDRLRQEADQVEVEKAGKQFFAKYVKLNSAYDSSVIDLYADDASIKITTLEQSSGKETIVSFSKTEYQPPLKTALSNAKTLKYKNTYQDAVYGREGDGIRITATRHLEDKDHDSPISILISKNDDGMWLIVEEISQSQP